MDGRLLDRDVVAASPACVYRALQT